MCFLNSQTLQEEKLHCLQGFSPECVSMCVLRLLTVVQELDIVNSADSAFFILKLVSLVSLNPHSIFILVAFSSLLHLYPRCIFIPVEPLSSLHLYPRCIFILIASLSAMHLYPQCIFILVLSFSCCFFFRIHL